MYSNETAQPGAQPEKGGQRTVVITGGNLTIDDVIDVSEFNKPVALSGASGFADALGQSVCLVRRAIDGRVPIYGVNTNFGGMANTAIAVEHLSLLQHNLLWGLKCGIGRDLPLRCVRAAMLIRSNTLSRGTSGIRCDVISRLLSFLNTGITPVLKDLGSLGASGDLIPLAYIAGAVIGLDRSFLVNYRGKVLDCLSALSALGLKPIQLGPKEGLALVNGTSVSAGIAAIAVYEAKRLLDLSLWINALFCYALAASVEPFDQFVHDMKPHPGQQQVAAKMRCLLASRNDATLPDPWRTGLVQDRYSIRCIPQYFGPLIEGVNTIADKLQTELNSSDDNPLVDVDSGRILQAGNFYGQYIGIGMDQLRQYLALSAKQLDAQLSLLVMPEFNRGLPPCLTVEGSEIKFGLKGLQIYLNSIIPRLLHLGNPIVTLFPTHAEQFNQNINSQSFNAAVLALESITLLKYYVSAALLAAIQGVELRAHQCMGTYLGRELVGRQLGEFYDAIYRTVGRSPSRHHPLIANNCDTSIDELIGRLWDDLNSNESGVFKKLSAYRSAQAQ